MYKSSNQKKGSLLAFIAVMLITPDSIFIRLSNIETWGMLFYRGAIPFVVVLIGLIFFYKNNLLKALVGVGYPGIFYVISFSICNITFIISIQNTNVANTLVMIAMAPMLSAILGAIFLKETPDRKTWISIIITFFAIIYIFFDSLKLGNFYGDILGFITAIGLAVGALACLYVIKIEFDRLNETKDDPLDWPGPKVFPGGLLVFGLLQFLTNAQGFVREM